MKAPIFRSAAAADVEEAYRWYESQRIGLGEEFFATLRTALDAVVANPEQFPIVHRNTRRALVRRFPYGLFFRIVDDQAVIVACMHARRDPQRWQSRE